MARIIYSLQFDLRRRQSDESVELIAPLDGGGQSPFCRAVHPRRRVVGLRAGDRLYHGGQIYVVITIRAYQENVVDDDQVGSDASSEGFAVPAKATRRGQS